MDFTPTQTTDDPNKGLFRGHPKYLPTKTMKVVDIVRELPTPFTGMDVAKATVEQGCSESTARYTLNALRHNRLVDVIGVGKDPHKPRIYVRTTRFDGMTTLTIAKLLNSKEGRPPSSGKRRKSKREREIEAEVQRRVAEATQPQPKPVPDVAPTPAPAPAPKSVPVGGPVLLVVETPHDGSITLSYEEARAVWLTLNQIFASS